MKKKVMAAAIFAAAVFCFIFTVGCGKNTLPQGHGTLTIRDMFVAVGDSAQIEAEFSSGEPIPIEYLFDGNAISIEDGMVHALAAGETVQVFATTEYHNTEFTVTTTEAREESKEVFSISDISAWVGWQPSDFVPVFDASANISGEIQYEYDETRISVDAEACTVTALQDGKTVVKATCGGYAASFSVNCYAAPDMTGARYDTTDYNEYRAGLSSQWNNEAEDGKTTVFIGDSFFDTRWFWKDFYQTYAGKDALCLGISATTSYDWEKFLLKDNIFRNTAPKNIVMHIGTNNIYNDLTGVSETVRDLQRLFTLMHGMYPDTGIYYFGITFRTNDPTKIAYTRQINERMQEWCDERDWITYMDTPPELTADKLQSDGIHPLAESYSIFVDALAQTDIQIENKSA